MPYVKNGAFWVASLGTPQQLVAKLDCRRERAGQVQEKQDWSFGYLADLFRGIYIEVLFL